MIIQITKEFISKSFKAQETRHGVLAVITLAFGVAHTKITPQKMIGITQIASKS